MISFVRPSLDFGQFRPNSNAILQFVTLTSNFTPLLPISDAIVKTACNLGNIPFFCWSFFFSRDKNDTFGDRFMIYM